MKEHESSLMFGLLFLILAEHLKGLPSVISHIAALGYAICSILELMIYKLHRPKK